jgi:hypothetical protein
VSLPLHLETWFPKISLQSLFWLIFLFFGANLNCPDDFMGVSLPFLIYIYIYYRVNWARGYRTFLKILLVLSNLDL